MRDIWVIEKGTEEALPSFLHHYIYYTIIYKEQKSRLHENQGAWGPLKLKASTKGLHLQILKDIQQVVPNQLHGGNVQTLFGTVHAAQSRANTNHVEAGIFLAEQSALQAGMDG